MAATNVCGLAQHVARHPNRTSQYDLDEPFINKEDYTALITGRRCFNYNIPSDKLIRVVLNRGVSDFVRGQYARY